jgi:hypothetical protein
LALPVAAAFAAAPQGSARRAAQHLLLWIGAGIALTLTFAQQGFLIANGRDGTSSLLEWWSPRWELWTLAPSFIHHEAPTALVHSLLWLTIAAGAARVLHRFRARIPATAALTAFAALGASLLTASVLLPLLPDDPPMPRVNLEARPRLPALDAFDLRALPAALIFDPLRKAGAADILPALTLGVRPGLRSDPQPVRVLHNGRFSLPAGDYRIDATFTPPGISSDVLSLQVGRVGPPLLNWPLAAAPPALSKTIHLPVDASFIGFRGSRDVEQQLQSLTITPLAIVNRGARMRTPPVLGAAQYGDVLVLLHDDRVDPEPGGFWVLGRRTTVVSLSSLPGATAGQSHSASPRVVASPRASAILLWPMAAFSGSGWKRADRRWPPTVDWPYVDRRSPPRIPQPSPPRTACRR